MAGCVLAMASGAHAAFPDDPPNDPEYDRAEEDQSCTTSVNEEQHYFYSFLPRCTPGANDPDGASGMSVDKAWRDFSTGTPDTKIAYIEAGINWRRRPRELVDKVYLNDGELPDPSNPVGDGVLNARDYAVFDGDPTPDTNGNSVVDPEDIIVRFQNGRDEDGNGYTDDISGWDFYDDQNNPATVDGAYDHANNQMEQAAAQTNNGLAGAGLCPRCMVIPIKAGAEALDRTDDLAEAWNYAADAGADVVVSVTADLGYSTFMRQTVERLWRKGVVMVEASNDFNSTDHQGGMFWPHVIPGNGMTPNSNGIPGPAANPLTTSFRVRSGQTSWGTHNIFTASTQGGSTSTSTPTIGGVMGLVLSYGKEAAPGGKPLTGQEAIQVVRDTATDITDPTPWPARLGWDLQYGYGRPHLHRAMQAIKDGDVPPVAWIDSPDWYALYDPSKTEKVPVRGHVEARRSSGYSWKLEFAPGPEPGEDDWIEAGSGDGDSPFDGQLGELDLSEVPESFWSKAFRLSETKTLETNEHYTVSLRVQVKDDDGRVGEERRTIAVQRDPSWVPGFPKEIGPGGEAQSALADLQGRGRLAIVFGDTDGVLHAVDGVSGQELPGWPQRTDPTRVTRGHEGVEPGHEPVISNVAVGDLDHTGALSVVAASTTGKTYVWDENGRRRAGWPKALRTGVAAPPSPRPNRPFTRDPVQGSTAPPVLYDMDGDRKLEVIQAAWDGHLYVWRADGTPLPGWPVKVERPEGPARPPHQEVVRDHKLITPPAVADLDGDRRPELVARSQWTEIVGAGIQPGGRMSVHAFHHDGKPVDGYRPLGVQGLVEYYGSAQEFITEGSHAPAAADTDGDGADEVATAPVFSPTYLFDGRGQLRRLYGPLPSADILGFFNGSYDPEQILAGNLPNDTPISFTASGSFGRLGGSGLTYAEPGSGVATTAGALLFTGSGLAITNSMRAYDAGSGANPQGYPAKLQGLNFLGAPSFADVTGDGRAEVLGSGDSSALHGYDSRGRPARGFPKFQTGWTLYAPSVGDLDSDGRSEVVALTREGYLMAWRTPGRAEANAEWWSYRHDERNTGRYGVDTRPPGVLRAPRVEGSTLTFTTPGDDWYAGRATSYLLTPQGGSASSRRAAARATRPEQAGRRQSIALPARASSVRVQAVDEVGNLGRPITVRPAAAGTGVGDDPEGDEPEADSPSPPSMGANERRRGDTGALPFTGLAFLALMLVGLLLLVGGMLARRRSAP